VSLFTVSHWSPGAYSFHGASKVQVSKPMFGSTLQVSAVLTTDNVPLTKGKSKGGRKAPSIHHDSKASCVPKSNLNGVGRILFLQR
jgi:hypothetical protein